MVLDAGDWFDGKPRWSKKILTKKKKKKILTKTNSLQFFKTSASNRASQKSPPTVRGLERKAGIVMYHK